MLGQKAVELVVHAVAHAASPVGTEVVAARHERELRVGAAIRHADALPRLAVGLEHVADVEAVARRAHRSARPARQAPAAELVPEAVFVERVHEHGDFLDVRDVGVEGALATARGMAELDAVLVGGFADIAGRL